jgi:FMN phosphatase YigB (HAD superfamily)
MPTIRSFDVFDTVLTRRVGAPSAVVDLLSKRLAGDDGIPVRAAVFAATRKRFETQLTVTLGRHATLREIYHAVTVALIVDTSMAEEWAAAEEQLERELTVPVPGALERIETARAQGRVVFVSDTPHSEEFVKSLLVQHHLARAEDLVFTSSERQVSKSHGGLFEAVRLVVGGEHQFRHVGDNPRSDGAAARVEGWAGTVVPAGQLSRYEKLLEERSEATDGVASWLAGASRLARLEASTRNVSAPIAEVASGVLAPLLVGFALWVTAQARQSGVRRLYFVARDGEVMLDAARFVIGHLAPDIELRYLYGSRQPWIFAASATADEFLADWVLARPDYTARTLLARVELTPEQVSELTSLPCCHLDRADRALTRSERLELADALQSEPLISMVRARAKTTAEHVVRYLRQEGLMDGPPSALVDAGWGGRTAHAFDHLLREAGAPPVEHFLVGIRGSKEDLRRRGSARVFPWLFDEQMYPASVSRLPSSHTLIEMLCAGSVGRTLDYEVVDGESRPVLAAPSNEAVVAWGLPEVQRTAVRVAELLAPQLSQDAVHMDLTEAVFAVLRAFWVHPSKAESAAWGTFPWEEEIWLPFAPIAQRITTREIVERLLRGDRQIRRVNSWRAGSAQISSEPWKTLLKLRGWQLDNRPRLRRVPRRVRLEMAARRRKQGL